MCFVISMNQYRTSLKRWSKTSVESNILKIPSCTRKFLKTEKIRDLDVVIVSECKTTDFITKHTKIIFECKIKIHCISKTSLKITFTLHL